MPRRDKYEAQHAKNRVLYEQKIKQIFTKVCQECGMSVTQLASLVESAGENAEIAKIPAVRKVLDKLHSRLAKELKTVVIDGIKAEWKLANSKYDALVGTMVAGDLLEQMKEAQRKKMMAQNLAARDAFIARKEDGLNLSQKVWNYSGQMRDAIESSLEFGIWEGRSAAEIARDLKQYLVYPDKLFRRIRIKAEEDGKEDKFRLSKAAAAFHPGQGVYRSSYKNALRLALNETNIAYRKADTMRRVGLNFVVGIEVHLSNNHNCKGVPEGEFFDICDLLQGKYPPDFDFSGWHTNCYSDDSEVLTNRGWQLFRDVVPNDWILSLNPDTRKMEWATISAMQSYPYSGPMVHFFNRSLDCLVTPEHRMVYLHKASGIIKYLPASIYRKGNGAFYRGCDYDGEDINSITIGEKTYDFDAFCRFMGFWLADGACFNTSGITIAQDDNQPAKPKIIEAVRALGYEPTIYPGSVRFYRNELVRYLRQFGHCNEKYIPDVIKRASRHQIQLFLDAFLQCDGSVRQPKDFIGNRGAYFHSDFPSRVYYTTSRRMAGDLCELILKVGHRPSVSEHLPGMATKRDGAVIKSNYSCFRIAELKATTATVFDKEIIDYDGMVYDLTLAKNHIMYIKRNGRCFWGSNCRCYTTTILQTEDEFFRDSDGVYRGSVNEVKDVPPQFKKWLEENKDRIAKAEKRGKLPYFLRDNRWAWQEDAERPNEKKVNTALVTAEERHAARTPEQIQAIKDRWAIRGRAMRNADRVIRLVDAVPGMREYLKDESPAAINYLTGETIFDGNYEKLGMAANIVKNRMKDLRSSLDVLDQPWEVLKEHGVVKTVEAAASVRNKMAQWSGTTLEYQLKKLKFEAQWIEDNKKGVLSTWKVAQDAYLKAARRVEWEIEWKPIVDELNAIAASPYADPDMVAEVRSYIGKDKDEAEYALSHLKIDTERNELEDKFESLYRQAPGAFNANFRKSLEDAFREAFDSEGIKELRMFIVTAKNVISLYHDLVDEATAKLAHVKDQKVADALSKAVAKQEVSGLQDALELADREIKFQGYVAEAEKMLQQRDLLLKLKPQIVTWLEERSVPKDYSVEDVSKLKSAIDNAQWAIDEWEKKKQAYADHFQYMQAENIKSKAYKDLVMELRQAILDVDVAKVDELLPKVDEQKKKHEDEKAYRAGVEAEWQKMKDDVARISDALNSDTDILSKAATSGLLSLVVDFNANESGARKLREGRKTYKQILDLADQLGVARREVYTQNGVSYGPGVKVKKFAESDFSQGRKDKAVWYKTKSACYNKFSPIADGFYQTASQEEKDAQYHYTQGSGFMNRPLRGYNGSWDNFEGVGKVSLNRENSTGAAEIKAFTEFLDRCSYDFDVWVQRGIESDRGLKGFLGVDSLDEATVNALVGQTVYDIAFASCGSSKGTGFSGHIINIYCPKGTKMLYVEDHSAFGGGSENETIIQRNTFYRITKVEKSGYRWFIDVEVVAQI